MQSEIKPETIKDNIVVSMAYTLRVEGKVIESTNERPIQFIQGKGNIIPGLENALYDMRIGEKKTIELVAEDGYGSYDPKATMELPRDDFPDEMDLNPGMEMEFENKDGGAWFAIITGTEGGKVQLDFNHPLAGKNLKFDVKIMDLRHAKEDELKHGHIHLLPTKKSRP